MNSLVFVTGVERSGSTMIAETFHICGARIGKVTNMYENEFIRKLCCDYLSNHHEDFMPNTSQLQIPVEWKDIMDKRINKNFSGTYIFKGSYFAQLWPIWNYMYPDAKWIIVRRKTEDIVQSCMKTAYMTVFKNENNQKKIGVSTEADGWKWWCKQYEHKFQEMIESGLNCKVIWPEKMAKGDFHQIYEMLEWTGLNWNPAVVNVMSSKLNKTIRREK